MMMSEKAMRHVDDLDPSSAVNKPEVTRLKITYVNLNGPK